ncbi:MAG: hypothetical protein AAF696_23415 [Bacteroidota bacterium]
MSKLSFVHSFGFLPLFLLLFAFASLPTSVKAQNLIKSCTIEPYELGDHAFWLNAIPGDMTRDYEFLSPGGMLNYYSDSTVQIFGRIFNQRDSSRQWDVEFWLTTPRTYAEWTALGRSIKNGGGADSTDFQDWIFYELDANRSFFRGVSGSPFDGEVLNVSNRPSNYNLGFQIGLGANDKNMNFGISGWFNFTGSYDGRGDINANIECPPPPTCSVMIDTVFASCASDSSFEMNITFTGNGANFQISDDQGTPILGNLSSGTYTFGNYFNSTDVRLTVSDPNFPNCTETTLPLTLDCTPVPVCDLVVDTLYTQCMTDTTFSVVVSFSGNSNLFIISDNRGTPPLDSLSAGTYTYGEYSQDTTVSILVQDWAVFNCFEQFDSLSDSCSADTSSASLIGNPDIPAVFVEPIFPNPVQHSARLKVRSEEKARMDFSIKLVDAMGRVRHIQSRTIKEGIQEFYLEMPQVEPGIYFMGFGVNGINISAQRILMIE